MDKGRKQLLLTLAAGAGWTLIYWFAALMMLGLTMLGDCVNVAACERSKHTVLTAGLTIESAAYLGLMASFIWRRRG